MKKVPTYQVFSSLCKSTKIKLKIFQIIDIQIRQKFALDGSFSCIKNGEKSERGDFVQKFSFASMLKVSKTVFQAEYSFPGCKILIIRIFNKFIFAKRISMNIWISEYLNTQCEHFIISFLIRFFFLFLSHPVSD